MKNYAPNPLPSCPPSPPPPYTLEDNSPSGSKSSIRPSTVGRATDIYFQQQNKSKPKTSASFVSVGSWGHPQTSNAGCTLQISQQTFSTSGSTKLEQHNCLTINIPTSNISTTIQYDPSNDLGGFIVNVCTRG